MEKEFSAKRTGYHLMLSGYTRVLFSSILRKLKEEKMVKAADRYKIHDYCGKSLSEYIKEKRILEAERLLKDTDLNNEEIMEKIGYTDKKQFYKNFKEFFRQTPAEFRKN